MAKGRRREEEKERERDRERRTGTGWERAGRVPAWCYSAVAEREESTYLPDERYG